MPSTIKTREIEIEITSDNPSEAADLYSAVMREHAGTQGSGRVSTTVNYRGTSVTAESSEYETTLATQGPAPEPPASSPVPVPEVDADLLDRRRTAAAAAREALAAQRRLKAEEEETATKAAQTAGDGEETPPAPKPRGRPRRVASPAPTALDDLSGDDEDGDLERTPDTEPEDYAAPPASTGSLTPEQQRMQCMAALRAVAETEAPNALDAIKAHVRSFGTAKIMEVPLNRMNEFWIATASLCASFSVPFPSSPATH